MHSFYYPIPLFVTNLYPCRPRSRFEFPNVSHILIVIKNSSFHNQLAGFSTESISVLKFLNLLC